MSDLRQKLRDAELCRLVYGPYNFHASVNIGDEVLCAVHGLQVVAGFHGPKQWPRTPTHGRAQLIVFGALAEAIRREQRKAVALHWGVSVATVAKWRRALQLVGTPILADRVMKGVRMTLAHLEKPEIYQEPGTRYLKSLDARTRQEVGWKVAGSGKWDSAELDLLSKLPAREAAQILGRTINSVRSARYRSIHQISQYKPTCE